MKKNKNITQKRKYLLFSIAFLGMIVCTISCGKSIEKENSSQEIAKQFLEQIFTSNYEERYTNFLEDEDLETYYKTFSNCTSQECIEELQQNRIPMKYDKKANEKQVYCVVSDVKVEFDETETGTFEVFLTVDNNESSELKKATGQLKVENGQITNFFLSNIVPYKE